ncbi:MAG: flagellar FlbD family protein [Pirellulales bacterium]|nr:flagellar FlbD family protein [Pirellulales bacterium]
MIRLTRINGQQFILNAELIRYIESLPDTSITLTDGDRLVVRESQEEVLRLALDYQRAKVLLPPIVSSAIAKNRSLTGGEWPA